MATALYRIVGHLGCFVVVLFLFLFFLGGVVQNWLGVLFCCLCTFVVFVFFLFIIVFGV